jgi:NAD(P)-dependent dehydrogenase (short-subunit alcohol dehydrogenase family)
MDLAGKTAIVTGGATGLGKATCLKLAAAGANLAIVYSRSETEANETAAECQGLGVQALALRADVAVDADVRAMVNQTKARLGRIDILINDAGVTIFHPMSDLDGIDEADWDRLMDVNVKAHWLTARAVAPHMREQGNGAIVNVTSTAGLRPAGSSLPYCVSKAGAIMLTKTLAVALAPEIRVNNVAPGVLGTRWWGDRVENQLAGFVRTAALKRPTPIEDVADAILQAISNDSMTGQTLVVDGGVYFH